MRDRTGELNAAESAIVLSDKLIDSINFAAMNWERYEVVVLLKIRMGLSRQV